MSDQEPITNPDHGEAMKALAAYMHARIQNLERVLAAINAEFGCDLHLTCEACPVQIEGHIDRLALYFRSRWDSWRLAIAVDRDSAIRATRQAEAHFYHESCAGLGGFDASWLEPEQVDQAMRACLTAFRTGQTNAGYVELGTPTE